MGWLRAATDRRKLTVKIIRLEQASTHKSAMAHAGNVFVPRDLDLLPFDRLTPKQMGFQDSWWNISFSDPGCICFWDIVWKTDTQTNKHIHAAENPTTRVHYVAKNEKF